MIYRCPKCGAKAEVDKEKNELRLIVESNLFTFPRHADCELAKPVSQINLDKLEKL